MSAGYVRERMPRTPQAVPIQCFATREHRRHIHIPCLSVAKHYCSGGLVLPFAVPNHPLIQARCERIQKLGGNPFGDYSIPDAVLKFRQGIGRLIRSKTDTGIIVVLDPRIMTRGYGRSFLESIPECPIEHF